MVCVFLSFMLGNERTIKEFGFGLAAAVFLDALVVRCVLLPAVLELLGPLTWRLPRWLDARLPAHQHRGLERADAAGRARRAEARRRAGAGVTRHTGVRTVSRTPAHRGGAWLAEQKHPPCAERAPQKIVTGECSDRHR